MSGVFVSYRRSDSAGHSGRLMDALVEGFEPQQLFRDIEAIEAGADFVEAINRAVADSSVMLVVIGPQWLTAQTSDGKRRIDQDNDFVRLEIEAALSLDLRVIPVLVGGASMPSAEELPASLKPLARRQAQEISDRRWDYDVDQLFATMEKIRGVARRKQAQAPAQPAVPAPPPKRGMSLGMKLGLGAGGAVVVLVGLGSLSNTPTDVPAVTPAPSTPPTLPASEPAKAAVAAVPAARKPAATVAVPPAPTVRDEQPAAEEAPQAVQPVARVPVNLTGSWRSPDGDQLYLEQQGNEVAVIAADGSGTQGFMGQGSVHGQRVDLTLVHMQSGGTLTMQMTVSQDGRRMNGVARENLTGSSENVTLTRE
jgi:hypothetical protein